MAKIWKRKCIQQTISTEKEKLIGTPISSQGYAEVAPSQDPKIVRKC